eukprot:TRINITY_DN59_c0_g1_i2.p1 TRINITY_DN59_c0_g1~~TRINITY_DN59_c0_g1_i2.p1  ORF type:complete len:276 (+),score=67.49 TRINITY_DN59_c0_g1_i2:2-829(+)
MRGKKKKLFKVTREEEQTKNIHRKEFFSFIRLNCVGTKHLGTKSNVVDDDERVPINSFENILKVNNNARLVIQEKVDGANVAVHFEEEWQPIFQKRGNLIQQGEKWKMYGVFQQYVWEHCQDFFDIIGTEYIIYGEWLWQQHNVYYENLPDYFMCFDIMHKETKEFLSYNRLLESVGNRFNCVPLLYASEIRENENVLLDIERSKGQNFEDFVHSCIQQSNYGSETAEGVYIRIEDVDKVIDRVKVRRMDFTSGRESFGKDNKTNKLANNNNNNN